MRPDYRTTIWGHGGFLPGFKSALWYVPSARRSDRGAGQRRTSQSSRPRRTGDADVANTSGGPNALRGAASGDTISRLPGAVAVGPAGRYRVEMTTDQLEPYRFHVDKSLLTTGAVLAAVGGAVAFAGMALGAAAVFSASRLLTAHGCRRARWPPDGGGRLRRRPAQAPRHGARPKISLNKPPLSDLPD